MLNLLALTNMTFTENIGITIMWCAIGLVLVFLGWKIFDLMETKIDFAAEIAKGNIAAALVEAAVILGIAAVVVTAIM